LAYGYNSIPRRLPEANTIAQSSPLNKLTDQLRHILAEAGWTEVLSFALCSLDDVTTKLRESTAKSAEVPKIANPKTLEFQVYYPC
jgi:phenylalanyl-tRNA synthetase beta chain